MSIREGREETRFAQVSDSLAAAFCHALQIYSGQSTPGDRFRAQVDLALSLEDYAAMIAAGLDPLYADTPTNPIRHFMVTFEEILVDPDSGAITTNECLLPFPGANEDEVREKFTTMHAAITNMQRRYEIKKVEPMS